MVPRKTKNLPLKNMVSSIIQTEEITLNNLLLPRKGRSELAVLAAMRKFARYLLCLAACSNLKEIQVM
jgi:hypothetical protein